jgi:hypothetical protein
MQRGNTQEKQQTAPRHKMLIGVAIQKPGPIPGLLFDGDLCSALAGSIFPRTLAWRSGRVCLLSLMDLPPTFSTFTFTHHYPCRHHRPPVSAAPAINTVTSMILIRHATILLELK